jgi:hypothetical protein
MAIKLFSFGVFSFDVSLQMMLLAELGRAELARPQHVLVVSGDVTI